VAQGDLITASGAGDLSKVQALIATNADADAKRGDGISASLWARKLPGAVRIT